MENAAPSDTPKKRFRMPITFDLLQLIGKRVSETKWSDTSKTAFWAVCLVAFWGSFRLGELLPYSPQNFDVHNDLLWSDVVFTSQGHMMVKLKAPKISAFSNCTVDLFPLKAKEYCPVFQLKSLLSLQIKNNIFNMNGPVFQLTQKAALTKGNFNKTLQSLVSSLGILGPDEFISGHSFRCAIPSILAKNPEAITDFEIQAWGRWNSDAYKVYTKLKTEQKREIFRKIVTDIFQK